MIERYGFIVKAENYVFSKDQTILNTAGFSTKVAGVSNDEEAILVAQQMIESGTQIIELCGGFGLESANAIRKRLDTCVPIGHVTFTEQENEKLKQFLP